MACHGLTPFESNELSSTADLVSPEEVRRNCSNVLMQRGLLQGDNIFLSHLDSTLSFTKSGSMKRYFRVWKMLELCYQLLTLGKKATQREIFYRLLCDASEYFQCQEQKAKTMHADVVGILKCSRYSLGILASARGAIVGRLVIQELNREPVDCTKIGINGYIIDGDLELLQNLTLTSDARYILVIEKDAVFQRLSEDRFFQTIPSILITAKGYPDLASRVMLHKLHRSFPLLPILALVDWNPCGLGIICTYKFGSVGMGLEAPHYVCDVKWLGVSSEDLPRIPPEYFVELSARDRQLAKGLLSSAMLQNHPRYREELERMIQAGKRVEIEALYAHGYKSLSSYVAQKIVQMRYF
ncbi:hypothetical protein SELMODRAFT_423971 [Selaginella moellendorffii]|uniref:DNA topoisomerase (ATP-hydrolyzing) n=1 Tax=Selaginella moellendorffii TaxID=88036 RepID=D8SND8_SELML|nr:hypothetical protein SELMODRAFT_423971 [Selaginella moellendorffii]